MSDSVFILGANGFIGRHLAETLAAKGNEVVAATRRPTKFLHGSIRNVVAAFDDASHFASAMLGCSSVIHAASISTPGSSAAKPQLDGNLRTTLALIEALQEHSDQRLVYLSSGGTLYGTCNSRASEREQLRPRSYHGAGKAAAEHFIHAWAAQYRGTAIILRPSNVFGPGQAKREGFGIVPAAMDAILRQQRLQLFGDGTTVRDFLYIDDFVELCTRVLTSKLDADSFVFNASSGIGTTINDLLSEIEAVAGSKLDREPRPMRAVDVSQIIPDNAAAQETFEWTPRTVLRDGLSKTWSWYVKEFS